MPIAFPICSIVNDGFVLVVTGGYGIFACFLNRNALILNHFHYLFFSAIY